jgi:hypothetical protein
MIYANIPYAPAECGKNIGCAYNKFMDALPHDNDYACFIDHDAMFTTSDWYPQMNAIVEAHPDVGAFGCRTNRNGHTFQLVGNIDMNNHDISYHRIIGSHLQKKYYDDVFCIHGNENDPAGPHRSGNTEQPGFSGTLILLKKSAWKQMGKFQTEEFVHTDASGSVNVTDGFLHVDSEFRKRLARHHIPFYIMNGIYVYHWYRADNPYPHTAAALKKIDDAFADDNKQNFDLNKIFLFDK